MKMSKRTRILIGLGALVVVCGAYLWFFGTQTFLALEACYIGRKMPAVKETPGELPDLSVSQAPGRKLSYFGYEFEVPWQDIDESKTRVIGGNKVVIAFRSGNALSVWKGSPHEFVDTVLSSGKIDRNTLRQIYGDQALQSDYEFHRIMLGSTPDAITPFTPKRRAISQSMLLVMKAIIFPGGAESGIFAIRTGEFKGFQYGRPQSSPRGLSVALYSDTASLDFIFGQKAGGPTIISQPDINRVLQTLHKAPAELAMTDSTSERSRK